MLKAKLQEIRELRQEAIQTPSITSPEIPVCDRLT